MRTINLSKNNKMTILSYAFLAAIIVFISFRQQLNAPNITNITTIEAKTLFDHGAIVFDVRENDAFDFRHIEGAISLPLSLLKVAIPQEYSKIKDKNIVVYCGDGITKGPVATEILNKAGYTKAVNLKPGIDGWQNAGYPIVKH